MTGGGRSRHFVERVRSFLGVSERRACKALEQPRSTRCHQPLVRDEEQALCNDIMGLDTRLGRFVFPTRFRRRSFPALRPSGHFFEPSAPEVACFLNTAPALAAPGVSRVNWLIPLPQLQGTTPCNKPRSRSDTPSQETAQSPKKTRRKSAATTDWQDVPLSQPWSETPLQKLGRWWPCA